MDETDKPSQSPNPILSEKPPGADSNGERRVYDRKVIGDWLLEHSAQGGTILDFAYWLVQHKGMKKNQVPTRQVLYVWEQTDTEFAEVMKQARNLSEGYDLSLLRIAAAGKMEGYQFRPHQFKMMNVHKWSNRVEHSGEIQSGPKEPGMFDKIFGNPKAQKKARELAVALCEEGDNEPEAQGPGEISDGEVQLPDLPEGRD